jgi:hypothetical protein
MGVAHSGWAPKVRSEEDKEAVAAKEESGEE